MHIEYLKLFQEVAVTRSISKVANNSHISQPALSQQIQRLEDSLGYKLLVRSNRGVQLTPAGRIVEKYAKNLIKAYDNMVEDLDAINKNNSTIRIEASSTLATYALPCTIYKVKEAFPEYQYNLISSESDIVEQNVLNDACDIGVIRGKPSDGNLSYSRIGTDRFVVISSYDFYIKQDINCKDLLNYPLILLHNKSKSRNEMNTYFNNLGYDLEDYNILFNLDSIESVKSCVAKGHGVSILPYISIKKELYTKELKQIQVLDFDISYEIYLIYKRNKEMSKSVKEFIQCFIKIGEKSFC